ncbi:MAG: helix-turn-helix domain-containing protein [Actinobacteria bacterium]|nr:helix-turn-helix domain-containing protein [Actinomycetota bacterium]
MTTLSPTEFASAVTAITSAFGDPTRREIFLFVHSRSTTPEGADGVTASEVAERFSLHANVARHHLDKLTAGGHLETTALRPVGGAGRPSKHYRTTDRHGTTSDEVPLDVAVRHDDVLVELLGRALAELGPERASALAEEVGERYGRAMATAMGDSGTRSFRTALHTVADALSAHGFAAHAEDEGNALRIVTDHCPFGDAVVEHPVICAVDRGMVKGMLVTLYGETDVELMSSVPGGDTHCVTTVDD